MRKLVFVMLAVVTAAVVIPLTSFASGTAVPLLGVYTNNEATGATSFASRVVQPAWAMDFLSGTSWKSITQRQWPYDMWRDTKYQMVWAVPMLPSTYGEGTSNTSCAGLAQGAAGDFDADFEKVAESMVKAGFGNSVIRLGWEFNGSWFPWAAAGCAWAFVSYYQQIVDSFRTKSSGFKFEWNPTIGDQNGSGNLANYYPGNAYVDYIGLDIYDIAWGNYPGASAEFAIQRNESYGLDWLKNFAASEGKPMVVPEWGLGWGTCSANGQPIEAPKVQSCGGDDTSWINDMITWFEQNGVYETTFWDYGTSSVDGRSNSLAKAALVSAFGRRVPPPISTTSAPSTTTTAP